MAALAGFLPRTFRSYFFFGRVRLICRLQCTVVSRKTDQSGSVSAQYGSRQQFPVFRAGFSLTSPQVCGAISPWPVAGPGERPRPGLTVWKPLKCFLAKKDPSAHAAVYFQFNLSAFSLDDFAVPHWRFPWFC